MLKFEHKNVIKALKLSPKTNVLLFYYRSVWSPLVLKILSMAIPASSWVLSGRSFFVSKFKKLKLML